MHPESDFTAPHAVCREPGRWHAPDGESTECEVTELVAAFVRAIQPELVVETGTAFGYTTFAIGEALAKNGHGKVVSLEVDEQRITEARVICEPLGTWVEIRRQSSLDYVPEQKIDFAWFDSRYELRAQEYLRYRELGALQAGTIVGFHDWTSAIRGHYYDVRADIDRLKEDFVLRPIYVPTPRGVVFAEVL